MVDSNIWHPVTLPSLGVYYGGKCPGGNVEITPWTTVQEEMLVRYGSSKPGDMIRKLVDGNVRLGELKHDELLITDRFFLLFQLRSISLVPYYSFVRKCPQCRTEHQVSVNINDMPVKVPDSDEPEPFEVQLPKCGKTVHVRMFRVGDEAAMMEYEQKVLKNNFEAGSPAYRFKLARQIEKIDGQSPKWDEKLAFIKTLVMFDVTAINYVLEQHESGFLMDIEAVCPRSGCGNVEKLGLPMEDSFFRPLKSDIERALRAPVGS